MRVKHHIYVLATQECCHGIFTSFIFNSKSEWKTKVNNLLGKEYQEAACVSMNAMNLSIYCHSSVYPYINTIESNTVKTGGMGFLGNKGALGISFNIAEFSILVLAVHLEAGDSKAKGRDEHFEKIKNNINLPKKTKSGLNASMPRRSNLVVALGDFNYRTEMNKTDALVNVANKNYDVDCCSKGTLEKRSTHEEIKFRALSLWGIL